MGKKLLNLCLMAIMMAVSMSAWALSEVNGFYQIGSAADFNAFAELVNGGNVYANAILSADIDLGATSTKVATDANKYQGLFDGAGHTITINLPDRTDDEGPALFRNLGNRGIIQNLKVQGNIATGKYKHTAAIVNYSVGLIRNCYVDITIASSFTDNDDSSIGGIAGQLNRPAIIENCLAKVKILGATTHKCGGLAAWVDEHHVTIANCLVINDPESNFNWSDGKSAGLARVGDNPLKSVDLSTYNTNSYTNRPTAANGNNYVTNNWGVTNDGTTVVTPDEVASGKVCYQLNSDQSFIEWVQNEGDAFPVPAVFGAGKGQMYASAPTNCQGKADGAVTFGNTPSNAIVTKHTYDKYGVCTTCGHFNFSALDLDNPTRFEAATKSVLVRNIDDLYLAEGWNRLQNGFKLNLKLANDVTCTPPSGQLVFNSADWMDCSFDGDGHTLTINFADITESNASFLPQFSGNFENVIMHGSISTSNNHGASISGYFRGNGQKIRNVFSDITINTTKTGDNTCGGLAGIDGGNVVFENCIYAGDIKGVNGSEAIGGLIGWANGASYLTNCAFLGTMTNASGDSHTIGRNNGQINSTNVYSLTEYNNTDAGKYVKTTAAAVANGELAFLLNGKQNGLERFFQKLDEDPMPIPIAKEGALVYCVSGQYRCDGTPIGDGISYTNNSSSSAVIPPHDFVDGFCTVCGKMQEDFVPVVDGWYEVSTPAQLKWMSIYALENTNVSIRLMADIDYTEYPDGMIGTDSKRFTGSFDGQMHTVITDIKNETKGTGLFGSIVDATIKNLVLEGSVESSQKWIGGIAGITRGDNTLIENVLVKSTIKYTGSGDSTGGGLCGDMEGAFTVKNCAFIGSFNMPNGTNVGGLVSWTGGGKFYNCYVAPVEVVTSNSYEDFISGGGGSCNNCYAVNKNDEKLASGELCYLLNDKQFRNPVWYQLLGEDEYPNLDSSRGTVLKVDKEYYSLTERTVSEVIDALLSYYSGLYENAIAYTGAIEDFDAKVEDLEDVTTVSQLLDALDSIYASEALIEASVQVYKQYKAKCEEVKTYLKEHDELSNPDRVGLEAYLEDECPEIMEEHDLPDSVVQNEIVRVEEWLTLVIKNGKTEPGKDMTAYLVNANFRDGVREGWSSSMNKYANGHSTVTINEKPYYGCEAWNTTFDMHQTVKGLKPGYYLVCLQGAFRPSNDRYSYNYVAQVYANDNVNYLQTVIEDYVNVADTINGENVYLSQFGGGNTTYDLPIYADGFSEKDGDELLGYAVHGPSGVAVAGYAGRYKNYIIAKTEGDSLTIGVNNLGTNYGNDWTGFSSFSVVYAGEGEEAEKYVDVALESMVARANVIIEKYRNADFVEDYLKNEAQCPSYPVALKASLEAAVAAADAAEGTEAKMKVVETLSQLFKEFYEARQAYLALYDAAKKIEAVYENNLPLVEKDGNNEWVEKDDFVFNDDESVAIYNTADALFTAYKAGSYSIEEAKNAAALNIPSIAGLIPVQDEDGYLQISTPQEFVAYRALVIDYDRSIKAKLINDIDMTGICMKPFGNTSSGTDDSGTIYTGTLDGQGHALENVYLTFFGGRRCGLFYELQNATVKNLKITGEYHADGQRMGGLTGWTSGNTKIENCEIAVAMYADIVGDATAGGIMGVNGGGSNTTVTNCLINCSFYGENAHSFGGVCGWKEANLTLTNVLVLSQYKNTAPEPTSYPSDVLSRNGCTANNVYYAERSLVPGASVRGTKVTDAQLASGEVCYKLNDGKQGEDAVWFQTIGEDTNPVLDKTHGLVLYDVVLGYHNEGDDEDAIESLIPTFSNAKGFMYDLSGRKIPVVQSSMFSGLKKGIYIVDGKKILVK